VGRIGAWAKTEEKEEKKKENFFLLFEIDSKLYKKF